MSMSNEDGISVSPDPRTDSRAYPSTGLYFPQGYPSPHESQVSLPVSDATNSSNKYRKACDACRLKKIRCLGERPVCSNCQSLNIACVYGVRKKKRVVATENSATGSNVNIEKRLIRIESMLRSVVNSTQHLNADAATKSLEDKLGDAEYGLNEPSTIAEIDDAAYTGNHKPGGLFDGFYMKDSLGRFTHFGPSSFLLFLKHSSEVATAMNRKLEFPNLNDVFTVTWSRLFENSIPDINVPFSKDWATENVNFYCDTVYPFLPIFCKDRILQRFCHGAGFVAIDSSTELIDYAIFNLLLSMGTFQRQSRLVTMVEEIPILDFLYFFNRFLRAYKVLTLTPSTLSLQLLILATVAFRTLRMMEYSWEAFGKLVVMVKAMGLSTSYKSVNLSDHEKYEHACLMTCVFMLDRSLAVSFGRPPLIKEEEFDLNLFHSYSSSHIYGEYSEVFESFVRCYISLTCIQSRIITFFDSLSLNPPLEQVIQNLYTIDFSLESWYNSLTYPLQHTENDPKLHAHTVKVKYLQLLYISERLLLHRVPFIHKVTPPSTINGRQVESSYDICMQSARQAIMQLRNICLETILTVPLFRETAFICCVVLFLGHALYPDREPTEPDIKLVKLMHVIFTILGRSSTSLRVSFLATYLKRLIRLMEELPVSSSSKVPIENTLSMLQDGGSLDLKSITMLNTDFSDFSSAYSLDQTPVDTYPKDMPTTLNEFPANVMLPNGGIWSSFNYSRE